MNKSDEAQSQGYLLKIFNGLHKGADVPLSNGPHTLGNSETCDIMLQDESIAPEHMVIIIKDDRISIIEKDGFVLIDGKKIGSKEMTLEPLKAFYVGRVCLGIGFDGVDWVPELLPDLSDEVEPSGSTQSSVSGRDPISSIQKLIVAAIFIPFIGAMLFILNSSYAVDTKASDKIMKLFESYKLPKPKITIKNNGALIVIGYAANEMQKDALENDIQKLKLPVTCTIYADSILIDAVKNVLEKFDFPVKAIYEGQGRFLLQGIVNKQWSVQKIALKVKQDTAGVQEIVDNIWLEEEVIAAIEKIIDSNGLNGKISIRALNDYFLIEGGLNSEEKELWANAKKQMFQKYGDYLKLNEKINTFKISPTGPGIIKLPIKSVHMGELPYITLKGGNKYFEGGSLKSGYTIKSITPERIVVLVKGKLYYCIL